MSEPSGSVNIIKDLRIKGTAASPGVAIGPLVVLRPDEQIIAKRKIKADDVGFELARLEQALLETRRQIQEIKSHLSSSLGEKDASIFDAHLLVVEDNTFLEAVKTQMAKRLLCVEYIYQDIAKSY